MKNRGTAKPEDKNLSCPKDTTSIATLIFKFKKQVKMPNQPSARLKINIIKFI